MGGEDELKYRISYFALKSWLLYFDPKILRVIIFSPQKTHKHQLFMLAIRERRRRVVVLLTLELTGQMALQGAK